jgi:hypothetical protein
LDLGIDPCGVERGGDVGGDSVRHLRANPAALRAEVAVAEQDRVRGVDRR